jgi:hypothetical protein
VVQFASAASNDVRFTYKIQRICTQQQMCCEFKIPRAFAEIRMFWFNQDIVVTQSSKLAGCYKLTQPCQGYLGNFHTFSAPSRNCNCLKSKVKLSGTAIHQNLAKQLGIFTIIEP